MPDEDYVTIKPVELKAYMDEHKERAYMLLDVRLPEEYEGGHIPGATLFPISDLESAIFDLPADRAFIFYCRNGQRSRAAASLAFEAEITEHRIMHLHGGMMLWNGMTIKGYPRIRVFEGKHSVSDTLHTAMDLEKGAFRFYSHIAENHGGIFEEEILYRLLAAERSHAKILFDFWKKTVDAPPTFDDLYDGLGGEILEGGQKLSDMTQSLGETQGDPCISILELCIDIELSAYELYRTMADKTEDEELREAFISIAQSEKNHMRLLFETIRGCAKAE